MPLFQSSTLLAGATAGVIVACICGLFFAPKANLFSPKANLITSLDVAFVGNSFVYFNDMPRLFEAVSGGRVYQNSMLTPSGGLEVFFERNNGMWNRWRDDSALVDGYDDVWDFGACNVDTLLFGHDADEAEEFYENNQEVDDDIYGSICARSYANPCLCSKTYINYLAGVEEAVNPPTWDYVVIADKSGAFLYDGYCDSMIDVLENRWVPRLTQISAVPVFLDPYGYWKDRSKDEFSRMPEFTARAYQCTKRTAEYISSQLPPERKPKIIPFGVAFLTVWEENANMWYKLVGSDFKHPSRIGAFLMNCVLHHSLFGYSPHRSDVILDDMSELYSDVREMMYPRNVTTDFPSKDEAEYLYYIAQRVSRGHIPQSLKDYWDSNGLSSYS